MKTLKLYQKSLPSTLSQLPLKVRSLSSPAICCFLQCSIQFLSGITGTENESFGRQFFSFHNILSMINIRNAGRIQPSIPVMWVLEVAPPFLRDYIILITRYDHHTSAAQIKIYQSRIKSDVSKIFRYMEFEPATWSRQIRKSKNPSLVWANSPSIWPFLEEHSVYQDKPQETVILGKRGAKAKQ